MKSATALFLGILMFTGSLFPQTDVEEVFKIPGLVVHYQFHKRQAGASFDIWQFLDMHYNSSSEHAKTPHEGVKIPLYNHLSTGFVFVVTHPQRLPIQEVLVAQEARACFTYQNLYSFQATSPLLHPPQVG